MKQKKTNNKQENKEIVEINNIKTETNLDNEKIEKINKSLFNIKNKKSKFIFCVPDIESPVASVYEIYFHAHVVRKMGYDVYLLAEKADYSVPDWIESELTENHKIIFLLKNDLSVSAEDVLIIPEIFSNVMEHTKNLPCLRIGLLQSMDYMLNALIPGADWTTFGIQHMITTSLSLKEIVEAYYGINKFNIKTYDIGIPDYFKKSEKPQKPIISIVGRNQNEITKVVKLFFQRFPQYTWISFDAMVTNGKPPKQMDRRDFAKRLANNFAAIWIDRISSFGTFPLECMKCGVIPIALKPDIIPDYLINRENEGENKFNINAGVWTENYYDIPLLIGDAVVKFLDDSIPNIIYETMNNVSSKYSQENSEKTLIELYNQIISERITLLESAIN